MHRGNMRKLLSEETWTMEEYEKFISVFDVRTEEGMAFECFIGQEYVLVNCSDYCIRT